MKLWQAIIALFQKNQKNVLQPGEYKIKMLYPEVIEVKHFRSEQLINRAGLVQSVGEAELFGLDEYQVVEMESFDSTYTIPKTLETYDNLYKAYKKSPMKPEKYESEVSDCDDYARTFQAYCLANGVSGCLLVGAKNVKTGRFHQLNLCVAEDDIMFLNYGTMSLFPGTMWEVQKIFG